MVKLVYCLRRRANVSPEEFYRYWLDTHGPKVKNAAEAFRISELQYREGVADLLAVLQTQQTLFTAQDTLVQIKLARLQSNISLYRALGGGWSVDADKDAPTRNDFMPLPIPIKD